jgi:hypothetical protein
MGHIALLFRVAVGLGLVNAASGADSVFRSGPRQVALIELYTSEGCSSCPPAEKWLGELRTAPGLWRDFVPVAFHVNYWDHLGWRDALASKAFTEREHAYAEAWRASSVYTPCFVRNGAEWRPDDRAAERKTTENDAGVIELHWQPEKNAARIEYTPATKTARVHALDVTVALLGGGIVSNVRKGENAGRELRHEFVVLRLESHVLHRGENGLWTATLTMAPRGDVTAPRRAIAAWVSARGQLAPIQAVGGWME